MTKTQSKINMNTGQIQLPDHSKMKLPEIPKKEKHLVHWFRKGKIFHRIFNKELFFKSSFICLT